MQKPHILYLINGFKRGGAEKGLLHLMRTGAFAECEVTVVSIVTDQGAYVEDLRQAGATVVHLSTAKSMRPWDMVMAIPRYWRAIGRFRPTLVISSLPQANIAGRIAAMFRPGVTLASFEHNTHLAKPIYERLFMWTSWRVDWLLADCATTAEEAIARLYRGTPRRQSVLPLVSFPPTDVPPALVDDGHGDRPFTIIGTGRFTSVKNQESVVRAAQLLKERGVRVRFRLFGEGAQQDECEALAKRLDVAEMVDFPGFSPNWMTTGADAFLVASRHEGLCIVALEAMNQGLPVISTYVGGMRDYGAEAAVQFIATGSPADIAEGVERLLDDPEQRQAMRKAGRAMVERRFTDEAVGAIYQRFAQDIHKLAKGDTGASVRPVAE